ncbi:pyridoxal-phosphate dependent enzyme, partial [Clostridioides difficile]
FAGCSKTLKKHNSSIKCYVVEPETAAIYSGKEITDQGHKIQGGGYSMDLPLVDKKLIDGYIQVTDEEATDVARKLAKLEGVFAGFSSGANVCAAIKLLKSSEKGKNIVL